MTHVEGCDDPHCGCAELALAQAQSRVTQLEAVVNTRDLAIKRWCDELAQAQGDYKETREELQRVLGLLMDQDEKVERLTAALTQAHKYTGGHAPGALPEHCFICAALTEPGGQPFE